jgi:hypothetical protein
MFLPTAGLTESSTNVSPDIIGSATATAEWPHKTDIVVTHFANRGLFAQRPGKLAFLGAAP